MFCESVSYGTVSSSSVASVQGAPLELVELAMMRKKAFCPGFRSTIVGGVAASWFLVEYLICGDSAAPSFDKNSTFGQP